MDVRDSTFTSNQGGVTVWAIFGTATFTRLTFRDNIGGSAFGGADMNLYGALATISECRFSNSRGGSGDAKDSGALRAQSGSNCRVLDSTFEDTYSEGDGGAVAVFGSYAEFIRTTFEQTNGVYGGVAAVKDESTAYFQECVLREGFARSHVGGIYARTNSVVNITKCALVYCRTQGHTGAVGAWSGHVFIQDSTFDHNEADMYGGDMLVTEGARVEVVRTVFTGARGGNYAGSLNLDGSSSTTFTDSTFLDAQAGTVGGLARIWVAARAEFVRCSISATTSFTSVFQLDDPDSSLSIVDSVIANITQGSVIIDDTTGDEFATQLDLVTFDASNTIPALQSTSTMLVQSCDGLELSDMTDASVGVCATTTQFCMPTACEDAAVGIDCFCYLDGVTPTTEPLPAGCMDSGELAMAVPSSRELPLTVVKPGNITQEVRAARMKNGESSDSMHE